MIQKNAESLVYDQEEETLSFNNEYQKEQNEVRNKDDHSLKNNDNNNKSAGTIDNQSILTRDTMDDSQNSEQGCKYTVQASTKLVE